MTKEKMRKYISFSQLSMWLNCPESYFLSYIAKAVPKQDNEYTLYGSAFHETCEMLFSFHGYDDNITDEMVRQYFHERFRQNYRNSRDKKFIDGSMILKLGHSGKQILPILKSEFDKKYKDYKVFGIEEKFTQDINDVYDIEEYDFKFTGYIDLIIECDGEYHLFDFKTSNKGWSDYVKKMPKKLYQMPLYRKFFADKYDIPKNKIHTHFIICSVDKNGPNIDFFDVGNNNLNIDNIDELEKKAFKKLRNMLYSCYDVEKFPSITSCHPDYCDCRKYQKMKQKEKNEKGIENT